MDRRRERDDEARGEFYPGNHGFQETRETRDAHPDLSERTEHLRERGQRRSTAGPFASRRIGRGQPPAYFGTGNYASGGSGIYGGYGPEYTYGMPGYGMLGRGQNAYRNYDETRGPHPFTPANEYGRYRSAMGYGSTAVGGWQGEQPARGRHFGVGPKGYKRSDERIHEDIAERLYDRDDIDCSEVSVAVKDGHVTLEGTVPDRYMKHAIEDIADSCAGVREIENRIRVVRPVTGIR